MQGNVIYTIEKLGSHTYSETVFGSFTLPQPKTTSYMTAGAYFENDNLRVRDNCLLTHVDSSTGASWNLIPFTFVVPIE